jgi:hypothetical protein
MVFYITQSIIFSVMLFGDRIGATCIGFGDGRCVCVVRGAW